MQLPTAEDVNATRLTRFDDAISAALGQSERVARFRDIIGHYVEHHDVPEADVAAALAIVAQGEEPLLLTPGEDRPQRFDRDDRAGRGDGEGRDRGDRPERRERRSSGSFTTYRIAVGKRHRVEPRQIVGALANEGGFSREDFGAIDIRPDFSLVELPNNLSDDVIDKLRDTRISGKLIEIRPDRGGPGARRREADDRPPRKPRQH
jgi:ATP-dependent RNA helicase DeaD